MKYNEYCFWLFSSSMKKVVEEKYDKSYANTILKKSKTVYWDIAAMADDIGNDNPMAHN